MFKWLRKKVKSKEVEFKEGDYIYLMKEIYLIVKVDNMYHLVNENGVAEIGSSHDINGTLTKLRHIHNDITKVYPIDVTPGGDILFDIKARTMV